MWNTTTLATLLSARAIAYAGTAYVGGKVISEYAESRRQTQLQEMEKIKLLPSETQQKILLAPKSSFLAFLAPTMSEEKAKKEFDDRIKALVEGQITAAVKPIDDRLTRIVAALPKPATEADEMTAKLNQLLAAAKHSNERFDSFEQRFDDFVSKSSTDIANLATRITALEVRANPAPVNQAPVAANPAPVNNGP